MVNVKILHISSVDSKAAGVIAFDMNRKLNELGYISKLLVPHDSDVHENVLSLCGKCGYYCQKVKNGIKKRVSYILQPTSQEFKQSAAKYCMQGLDDPKSKYHLNKVIHKFPFCPDVIVLYWTHQLLSAKHILEIYKQTGAQIVWILPDMGPMTGGCHYAWDCNGYKIQCGQCPGIRSDDPHDIAYKKLMSKKKYLDEIPLTVITCTEWLYRQAKSSIMFRDKTIVKAILPIDSEVYSPGSKHIARDYFGIPHDKKVLFFGAQSLLQERKGMKFLIKALKIMKDHVPNTDLEGKVLLAVAGRHCEELSNKWPFESIELGLLDMQTDLPKAFQAADIFVSPSIEDSGPMMINQAVMSGTPVVAFEMGVAPDLVLNGVTGYCAMLKDSQDLAYGMETMLTLDDEEYARYSKNCRQLAIKEMDYSRFLSHIVNHTH